MRMDLNKFDWIVCGW